MGATIIVDEPELATTLSSTHIPTSERLKAKIVYQSDNIGISVGMTPTGNRFRVARMVAQWLTFYAKAALN